jgi:hypothetical protein
MTTLSTPNVIKLDAYRAFSTPSYLRSWKDETKKDFDEFLSDCSGQDKEVPCSQVIRNVNSLIDSLPIDLAFSPAFGLEDNATVLVEWYKPSISQNIFSVIIEKDKIIYSLRDDDEISHGCLSWGSRARSMVNTILKERFSGNHGKTRSATRR